MLAKLKQWLRVWEFSRYERRALRFLVVLILIGSGFRIYQKRHLNQRLVMLDSSGSEQKTAVDSMFYQQPTVDNPLRINSAVQHQLEMLDGIGPVRAKRIIEYREQHGRYERVDDLTRVYGIGDKTVDSIRDLITVEDIDPPE